ncbi:MAG: YhcB family protein [Oceanospirillaceae bacterium]|nr:YhcB family protein [Oceanospirillaceae bacterium]
MEQTSIWIIGVVALAVGGLIGYLLGRSGSDASERDALNRQLDEAREELGQYKRDVTEHFEKTAELVNQLTGAYRDVHQHLAQGAQSLGASESAALALKDVMQPRLEAADMEAQAEQEKESPIPVMTDVVPNGDAEKVPEPPRDYATKAKDEEGTLSERYGLDKKKADEEDKVRDPADLAALKRKQQEPEKEPVAS